MIEFVMSIFTSGFNFVFTLLTTVKLDGVSLWTFILAFGLGAGLIRALMGIFNPTSSGAIAAGWTEKSSTVKKTDKQQKKK